MPEIGPARAECSEEVLLRERAAFAARLAELEARFYPDAGSHERVRRLRRLIGKLDNRIRLIRELRTASEV